MQNRLKSKIVWLSVLGQILLVLRLTAIVAESQLEIIDGIVIAVIEILTIFGVLNNPSEKDKF